MTHFDNAVGFERDIEGVLKAVRAEHNLSTERKRLPTPLCLYGLTAKDEGPSAFQAAARATRQDARFALERPKEWLSFSASQWIPAGEWFYKVHLRTG